MSWELASFLDPRRRPARRLRLVRALAAAVAGRRPGRGAGGAGDRRPHRLRRHPQRLADHRHRRSSPATRSAPAPGFAVGALAALVSNFWFGQGPWTPWQMAGWGLCGVLGARARAAAARSIGRLGLAAACGFAGVAYGALLNFSLMATYGGELSLERFLALEARAIPFDAAHAIGNVALALVAGPAMVRMLVRFRERFEWQARRQPRRRWAAAGRCSLLGGRGAAAPAQGRPSAARRRAGWSRAQNARRRLRRLARRRLERGDDRLGDARARGRRPQPARRREARRQHPGRLPAPQRRARSAAPATSRARSSRSRAPGSTRATSPAATWSASCAKRRRDNGSYEGWPNATAFAVIALRAAGAAAASTARCPGCARSRTTTAAGAIVPGSPSDADWTGAVLQAIAPARSVRRAVSLPARAPARRRRLPLGGSGAVNSQSTAWAVQGMLAAGVDPAVGPRGRPRAPSTTSPRARPATATTATRASSDQTPVWVTAQVLVAARRQGLPDRRQSARRPSRRSRQPSGNRRRRAPTSPRSTPSLHGAPIGSNPPAGVRLGLRPRAVPAPLPTALSATLADSEAETDPAPRARRAGGGVRHRPDGSRRSRSRSAAQSGGNRDRSRGGRGLAASLGIAFAIGRRSLGCAGGWCAATLRVAARVARRYPRRRGRRDRDPHPPHPQGVRPRAARARGARASCSSWPAGRRTTTSPRPGASASSARRRWSG